MSPSSTSNASVSKPARDLPDERAERAWRSTLAWTVTGLLFFEAVTGLLIWLLPFSVSPQFMVLTHTLVGVLVLVLWPIYQVRHWLSVRSLPFTHLKVTGYGLLLVTLACVVTGVMLTWQGLFGRRISYLADAIHIATGIAALVLGGVHVGAIIVRERRRSQARSAVALRLARRRFYLGLGSVFAVCMLGTFTWQVLYTPFDLSYELPEGYSMTYGEGRPFAPSLATTSTGGAVHPRALSGSASCGSSGCHEQIYAEWLPSAHRYASPDIAFQAVQKVMAENEGPDSTRYCAGCHDPIALFSGSKNIYDEDLSSPGAEEGVSCIACHRLIKTDLKGNASYVMAPPEFYAYELDEGPAAKLISDFLIRTYPRQHVKQYSLPLLKAPEYCGACHKQFIDEEINDFGWVQLQNQYDNWRKSHWNNEGDPSKRTFCSSCHERKGVDLPADTNGRCTAITVSCRECHMRLLPSDDPAAGDAYDLTRSPDDGKHRSHRFIGANQFMPRLLKNKGWEHHVELTERWLRGETPIPEIAHKWPALDKEYVQSSDPRPTPKVVASGPVIPIRIRVDSEQAVPGGELAFSVDMLSRKVGHDFPTGPLDIIQCWLETEVVDARGKVLHETGKLTEDKFVSEGSFVFKAEGVDAQGHLIDRHNLWELVGARFKRALFPGFSDTARFEFQCPAEAERKNKLPENERHEVKVEEGVVGPLTIKARLLYRKINQHLLNIVTGRKDVTAPVTVMATDEVKVPLKVER